MPNAGANRLWGVASHTRNHPRSQDEKFPSVNQIAGYRLLLLSGPTSAGWFVALLLVCTWWVLLPHYLLEFDQINFALAIQHFDLSLHRPQPPGDPLFVLLIKGLARGLPIRLALFVSGILAAFAAARCLQCLGDQLFAAPAGTIAALLFLTHPILWATVLDAPVRVYLALVASLVALCGWTAWQRASPGWFCAAAGSLGLLSGFRPECLLLLSPLLVAVAIKIRARFSVMLRALVLLAAGTLSWLAYLAQNAGGWHELARLLGQYFVVQTRDSSLLTGARLSGAEVMARRAVLWSSIGLARWAWALWFVRRSTGIELQPLLFLALWFLPAFLFHTAAHIGDPGHALLEIPALALVGGAVLGSAYSPHAPGHRRPSAGNLRVAMAVLLGMACFFRPPFGNLRPASYGWLAEKDRLTDQTLRTLARLEQQGPLLVIAPASKVSWRAVSYYLPSVRILVLNSSPTQTGELDTFLVQNEARLPPLQPIGHWLLPGCGRVAVLLPEQPEWRPFLQNAGSYRQEGIVLWREANPDQDFSFGRYRVPAGPPCEAEHGMRRVP